MNKLLRLTCKVLLLTLAVPFALYAQVPTAPKNLQSPNAASLGLYGEIPVSYFTGLPNIEVPLYNIQDGAIPLPITLSYHASGFRPDQHPGWVGMGWTLNAGGAITRQVNDMPDEFDHKQRGDKAGFYFTRDILNVPEWDQKSYMQTVARADYENDIEPGFDTEPDEFSFNFSGYSGKFYLGADGNWKVKCNKPVRVALLPTTPFLEVPFVAPSGTEAALSGYPKTFAGFTLTAEDGTTYVFGGDTSAIEYSMDFYKQSSDDWTAGAWYLTKIIKNGYEMNLTYERDSFVNQMFISVYQNIETKASEPGGVFSLTRTC
jgi:hypothetical protein